jgi:prevent-host-death family protein
VKTANVSTTKNKVSSILAEVKRGETYLITDRNVPVARIEPLQAGDEALNALAADGVVRIPRQKLDVEAFFRARRFELPEDASAVRTLIDDRDEGR